MLLQVGVKIFLKNAQGKYLMLHRSLKKYPEVKFPWDLPGGRIDPGKNLIENIRREVKEETGLRVTGQPQLISAQDVLRTPGLHVVRLTYVGTATGKITLDPQEHDDYHWYSAQELFTVKQIDIYAKEIIKKFFYGTQRNHRSRKINQK